MNHTLIADILKQLGAAVCDKVHHSLLTQSIESRAAVYSDDDVDTIYQIDRDVEEIIVPMLNDVAAQVGGITLMAEGIGDAATGVKLTPDPQTGQTALRIIMDPIDGTRGIMYDKRAAFFLAAAAPDKGPATTLDDVEVAVMVELPTSRSHLSDTLWAIKGQGAHRQTRDLFTGMKEMRPLAPSKSKSIIGGFAQIARFFPPGRATLAAIEDEMIATIAPDLPEGKTAVFEDQYISSGGQLYEVLVGHDRFVADIRATLFAKMKKDGHRIGHICHPYDVCAALIGFEAGIVITDAKGNRFNAPFDLEHPVDWIAYANTDIKNEVEPVLYSIMQKHGLK